MPAPAVLVVDNQDSFTFTLVDYLRVLGAEVRVQRSDSLEVDSALADERVAILISPGPGSPRDAGISVPLAAACIARKRPMLGVCLGLQAIAAACGDTVERVAPVHGKTDDIRHDGSGLFEGLPLPLSVTRYHSLGVRSVRDPLFANGWSEDGLVMGLRHRDAPVHGVQFHPESIASAHGHALLANFLKFAASA